MDSFFVFVEEIDQFEILFVVQSFIFLIELILLFGGQSSIMDIMKTAHLFHFLRRRMLTTTGKTSY